MENKQKVIIYCRVSSAKQVNEGNGLDSQEQVCRDWAKQRGYVVEKVFAEKGISGSKEDRPAFKAMLNFLFDADGKYIILAMDINRFARDVVVYGTLKEKIRKIGHVLQTVNMTLEDTDESELLENVSSALGQYERKKNASRTKKNMIEHAKQGFWVMRPPIGLKSVKIDKRVYHQRNEPSATYIQEALEGFAKCRFVTQKDVFDFLKNKDLRTFNNKPVRLTMNVIKNILKNPVYTGYFSYKHWDISYQKWAIDPIISVDTYNKIKDRLNPKKTIQHRKYNMDDETFPLRRFVRCAVCGEKLTGSKAKSKSGRRHLYYHCHNKKCAMYGKSIKQADIHRDFETILEGMTPNDTLVGLSIHIINEQYNEKTQDVRSSLAEKRGKIADKQQEKQKAFDLLMNSSNAPEIANMCKNKISVLSAEINALEDENKVQEIETMPLDRATDIVMNFIKQPLQVWRVGDYYQKQGVLNLCFSEPISYDREKKFGTPKLAPIFGLFDKISGDSEFWRAQKDSNSQSSDP